MFDFKFNWDPSIETGIDRIDAQHRELFRIGRSIEQILLTDFVEVDNAHLLTIIVELRNYITYHFYEEECFMQQINYPDFASHKFYHDALIKEINEIDCDNLHDSLSALKDLLSSWVLGHILIADHAIKTFLKL
ncbi:MAG: hemerythrin [Clostridia bacterium]|jgi:hemerythrin|nr:hemerythrin [Clostridia bacterium]